AKGAPRRVKERRGTLPGRVETPPEPLVTVDNILQADGRTFRGADGTTVKVAGLTRSDNDIDLRVVVTTPPRDLGAGRLAGRIIRVNRMGVRARMREAPTDGGVPLLTLLDDKGQTFRLWTAEYDVSAGGGPREYHVNFAGQKGQGDPARLVLTGRPQPVAQ